MIHKFFYKDRWLVFDVESAVLMQVDALTYALLDYYTPAGKRAAIPAQFYTRYGESEVEEALSEIDALISRGILFAEEEQIEPSFFEDGAVKALCLNVSHDCNLACRYCFASGGNFAMQRELMSLETAKKAVDFVVEASKTRRNIEIDFFGGEPLMNLSVVKAVVAYARELEKKTDKHFRFTITTNAVLLDEDTMDYLNETMDNVVLSLDGRAQVNDKMRQTRTGKGSYDIIIERITTMVKKREALHKDYYVRGTYTAYNLDFCEDVKHFLSLGFHQFSLEPVVEDASYPYAITKEHLPRILHEYERLCDLCLEKYSQGEDFHFFHFDIELGEEAPCAYKRRKGCSAGCEYVAVTPSGDLYPCHQFVGKQAYILGNVREGITQPALRMRFQQSTLDHKETCQSCFAKYFCAGGCLANAALLGSSMDEPYEISCIMHRKRIEMALYLKARLREMSAAK